MNCPVCQVALRIAERQGVEIDYCPQCRGVWLDRGELDKIIARSEGSAPDTPSMTRSSLPPVPPGGWSKRRDDDDDDDERYRGRNRKRGFFGELFDFD